MARIRTVKPAFFRHEGLYDAERESGLPLRLAFAGLWTACDKAGRFEWKPRSLKLDCLPYDDVDFSRVLDALATRGFLVRYAIGTAEYGCVPSWSEHQVPNNKEKESEIPPPPETQTNTIPLTREPRVNHATATPLGTALVEREQEQEQEQEQEGSRESAPQAALPPKPAEPAEPEIDLTLPSNLDRSKRGTRLPADWLPSEADADWALAEIPAAQAATEIEKFRDYWIAKPGKDGLKLDWSATWRNWVRKAKEYGSKSGSAAGRDGFASVAAARFFGQGDP